MADSSHTDYYQFDWDVVVRRTGFKAPNLTKIVSLLTLLVILTGFIKFINDMLDFSSYEFFWLMFCFTVLFVGIVGVFWQQISDDFNKAKVHTYQISHTGLTIDDKVTKFRQFNPKLVKDISDHLKEDANVRFGLVYLEVPLRRGSVELFFHDMDTCKRFMKALVHYVTTD